MAPGERVAPFLGETIATCAWDLPLLSVREELSCGKSCFPGKVRWRQLSIFFSLNPEDSRAKQSEMHQSWVCKYTSQYHIQNNVILPVVLLLCISSTQPRGAVPELQECISCCCGHRACQSLSSDFIGDSDGSVKVSSHYICHCHSLLAIYESYQPLSFLWFFVSVLFGFG